MSLEDRFYCTEGVLSSECPLKMGFTVSSHQSVPVRWVLLYRGCPLIGVSLEDRFYCTEGVLSSECPLETDFTLVSNIISYLNLISPHFCTYLFVLKVLNDGVLVLHII